MSPNPQESHMLVQRVYRAKVLTSQKVLKQLVRFQTILEVYPTNGSLEWRRFLLQWTKERRVGVQAKVNWTNNAHRFVASTSALWGRSDILKAHFIIWRGRGLSRGGGADSPLTAEQNTLNMRNSPNGPGALWGFLCLPSCRGVCEVSDEIRTQRARVAPPLSARRSCIRTGPPCVYVHPKYCKWPACLWTRSVIIKHVCLCVYQTYYISR